MRRMARAVTAAAVLAGLAGACADGEDAPASGGPSLAPPEAVVLNLEVPWGLAFLPNGDAVVTERGGRLNVIPAADPTQRTVIEVPNVVARGEGGLLGVAVSPRHATDRWIYAYLTTASGNQVVRFRLGPDKSLVDTEVVIDGIDSAATHNGGRIAFGPDGMLYVATGDAGAPRSAQEPSDLNGKILRMTPEGDPAPGNPAAGSVVFSSGHRNVQGLAWDSRGRLFATEFGQNTFDEVNLVERGRNYGWPVVEGDGDSEAGRFTNPVVTWTTDESSPSGMAFVDGASGPALYVAALRGERLWRIPVGADGKLGDPESIFRREYGRLRTVAVAPDGSLWIMTSNRDGRGDGSADRILRLRA